MSESQGIADTIAEWLEEHGGHPIRSEKVEPGGEQVLPDREQRELDALPARLALLLKSPCEGHGRSPSRCRQPENVNESGPGFSRFSSGHTASTGGGTRNLRQSETEGV